MKIYSLKRISLRRNVKYKIKIKIMMIIAFCYVALLVFYYEIISFYIDRMFWYDLQCETNKCVKILLVADPQIIGEIDETPPIGIRIWDSDRYIYHSYQHAVSHLKPNIIIFLGDLMDEGSRCTIEQYLRYVKRFNAIFSINYSAMFIYIPGDHDIGGVDWLPSRTESQFQQYLSQNQSQVIEYGDKIVFYKVNRLIGEQSNITINPAESTKLRIVLSHIPYLNDVQSELTKINPHLIFSGHFHIPSIRETDYLSGLQYDPTFVLINEDTVYTNYLIDQTVEIIPPTCSYRMGTTKSGFGAAVLDIDRLKIQYAIFWVHSRLSVLNMYLWMIPIIFSVFVIKRVQWLQLLRNYKIKNNNCV